MTNFQKIIGLIVLIFVVPFAAWMLRTSMDADIEKATLIQKELEKEFTYLSIMPGAVQTSYSNKKPKPENSLVKATYSAANKDTDIRGFYIKEATKSGWTFIREKSIEDWGRDTGGKQMIFYKGEYRLSIYYYVNSVEYSIYFTTKD